MYWAFSFKSIKPFLQIARLDKPWGLILLAFPTLSALVLTMNHFDKKLWLIFILGIILTRSAGCVINDIADQWLDGQVRRTKHRPLVSGRFTVTQAWLFFIGLGLACLSLLFFLPYAACLLALVGALMIVLYPYTKRFMKAPQLFLGIVFSLGVPMAYLSQDLSMGIKGWSFLCNIMIWVVIYDTIYAMSDYHDDVSAQVNTLAVMLKGDISKWVLLGYSILSLSWLIWGSIFHMGYGYFLGLLGVIFCYGLQYRLVCSELYFRAFLLNMQAGVLFFISILLGIWSG